MRAELSVCVLALATCHVNDLAQSVVVMAQGADMAPGDLIRLDVKMIVAEGRETRKHRIDLGLLGDEGAQGRVLVLLAIL